MTPRHLNPGLPIELELSGEKLSGFSIAALATYLMVPELNCLFDVGECPLDAVPLEHVFLTHAHGDHARCLLRHESLRRLLGMAPATYYVPKATLPGFNKLAEAWGHLESHRGHKTKTVAFEPLEDGSVVWLHRQLAAKAFAVDHSLPSLGYTLYDVRKKLKAEYQGLPGPELGRLRKEGVAFEEEHWHPRLTFLGDHTIGTLKRLPELGQSKVLLVEITFLFAEEREQAERRGHTHLEDFVAFVEANPDWFQGEHLVLKHFSMRYDKRLVIGTLKKRLPKALWQKTTVLL